MKCFSATISCRRAAAARRIGLVGAVASMLLPAPAAEAQSMAVKRLYAPATDVESGAVVLPTPREAASASQAAILFAPRAPRVRFDFATGGGVVRIAPLGPDAIAWSLSITEPGRAPAPLVGDAAELGRSGDSRLDARSGAGADGRSDGWADERNDGSTDPRRNLHESVRGMVRATERIAGQDAFGSPEPTRMIEFASLGGALRIDAALPVQPAPAEAALLLDDDGEAALLAYPVRWDLAAGEDLAFVVEARLPAPAAAPLADATLAARARAGQPIGLELRSATVRWADGSTGHPVAVEPFDGGAVVRFSRARAGDALVRIDADAVDRGGARWTRSTATIVPVAGSRTTLVGLPRLESAGAMPTGGWVDLLVPLATDEAVVFVAAELWAEGAGRPRCLGWIGGMTEIERRAEWQSDRGVARIGCASARLALAPGESLVCRNLRVHARDGFAPRLLADAAVDTAGLELDGDAFASAPPPNGPAADFGMPGIASVPAASQRSLIPGVGSHALVLTHGYCADENPWPLAQFSSDAWPYTDLNANRSHDWFAVDIASDAAQFKSYGIIGHSQGGCAALHLYAFYWSGLDWAGPGRLIQAVGSPFEGTPIAGNLAALGEVFGVQCGSNYDLTTAGAAAWLSAIPTSARAKVYTHTTTFTNNPFFYDYCNIFVDPFLSDPEDGVVEHASGHFPGANDMGLRSGWCHVSGMRDPAQTNDGNRNATMNAEAAR